MCSRRIAFLLAAVLLLVPVAASAGALAGPFAGRVAGMGPPSPASWWSALIEQARSILPGAAGGLAPTDRRPAPSLRQAPRPGPARRLGPPIRPACDNTGGADPNGCPRQAPRPGPALRLRPPIIPACDNTGTADPNGCPHT